MNGIRVAGLGLGLAVTLAALAGVSLSVPLRPTSPGEPVAARAPQPAPDPVAAPEGAPLQPAPEQAPSPQIAPEDSAAAQPEAAQPAPLLSDPLQAPPEVAPEDVVLQPDPTQTTDGLSPPVSETASPPRLPEMPAIGAQTDALAPDASAISAPQVAVTAPELPATPATAALPDALPGVADTQPAQAPSVAQGGLALPDPARVALPVPMDPPPASPALRQAAPQDEMPPAPDAAPMPDTAMPAPAITAMPGRPVVGLPGTSIGTRPQADAPAPEPDRAPELPVTALERNAAPRPAGPSGPLFALLLNDPGLPAPERQALAARAVPFAVVLNPMDPTAREAAELYLGSGKEVYLLAAGLPDRATPSDVDVTLGAYFAAVPNAAGLIDLPADGFVRNSRLMSDVMSVLARDGYGVITFAGGLGQASRTALAAGIAHAEVYRVLDPNDESPLTIRRFLDRAVFQAVQTGQVVVFGEASNAAMLEALDLWQAEGRADQVAVVPVSTILLGE